CGSTGRAVASSVLGILLPRLMASAHGILAAGIQTDERDTHPVGRAASYYGTCEPADGPPRRAGHGAVRTESGSQDPKGDGVDIRLSEEDELFARTLREYALDRLLPNMPRWRTEAYPPDL